MGFHVFAFTGSIGNVADTDLPAVSDTVLFVDSSSHFVMRSPMKLLAVWAGSASLSRAKFHSGQLSYQGDPQIRPLDLAATPPNNPNVSYKFKNEMVLPMGEALQVLVTNTALGPQQTTVVCVAADASKPLPVAMRPDKLVSESLGYSDSDREIRGNIFPVRLTSTVAAVANKWTQLSGAGGLAYSVALPGGIWELYCSEHQSANGQAHRWVFPFDPIPFGGERELFRPGFLSISALTNRTDRLWYMYPWGPMGRFLSDVPPILEVLANGADAAHESYQWLRKVNAA